MKQSYDLTETAEQLSISRRSVRTLIDRGELVAIKLPGINRVLVRNTDLAAFLARQEPIVPPARSQP